jgi:uncharacterized protein (UPF0276 family)
VTPFSAFSHSIQSANQAITGVGLRHAHYEQALSDLQINKDIDFVELHAENFFAKGGIARELLIDISEKYAVSIHGTSLGLGSNMPVPQDILTQFAEVVEVTQASLVSEHLCFNRANINNHTFHSGDLLPLSYNKASLDVLSNNIDEVQSRLNRPILIENLSAYLEVSSIDDSQSDEYSEFEFLIALCKQSGCGLLLDINNLIVNALNQKHDNVIELISEKLSALPANIIGEIHLAGYSPQQVNGFIVDDHANYVSQQCWTLYQQAINLFGSKPTLVEWDNNLPQWDVLLAEAKKAKQIVENQL